LPIDFNFSMRRRSFNLAELKPNGMKINRLFFILGISLLGFVAQAQLPSDLSKIRSSQITDDQLFQFVQKAQSSGQSQEDILSELKQRGLPDAELLSLSDRVAGLMGLDNTSSSTDAPSPVKIKRSSGNNMKLTAEPTVISKVFGAELFSGASPMFVPNLNIATPANYKVGPGDELLLEVYGNNVFVQKLLVSKEGFVNVKYAGLINVNGSTIQDLTPIIKNRLSRFIPSLAGGSSKLNLSLATIRSISVNVVGAVKKPGTITVPSLATLFNALYATGGPLENGSLRTVELIRGNKKFIEADLYDFLLKGDQSANIFLQDNDLIRVPFAKQQVQLTGLLNRTGIFEVKPSEKLSDLFEFAGGFSALAYQGRVTGTRNGYLTKEIIDIPSNSFSDFSLRHGDSLHVDSLIDKYVNRVTINGAVYKPGYYAWERGQQLTDLIQKAEGLKEEAFLGSVNVLRTFENLEKQNISVDLRAVLKGQQTFELLNEDVVTIFSTYELKDKYNVSISGPVRNPGIFPYADSITLQQLILLAGGFTDKAIPTSIEIGRNKKEAASDKNADAKVEIIKVSVNADLNKTGADFKLYPGDIVSVKSDPLKIPQSKVLLSGKVLYPGTYVLESREDRLSSILTRAGGLLSIADEYGVKVIRRNLILDANELSKATEKQTKNRKDSIGNSKPQEADYEVTEIAVNLKTLLKAPGTADDIILEDGDEIVVPQIKNVVTVTGEVLKPVAVQFTPGKGFNYYVSSAGGYANKARKSKSFVIYSNGRSKRTTTFLGLFKNHPKVSPGATVVVPAKPEKDGKFDPAKAGILISALSALVSTIAILKGL
jgi:protein involved in polysaccharide export with SLBB domain